MLKSQDIRLVDQIPPLSLSAPQHTVSGRGQTKAALPTNTTCVLKLSIVKSTL
jgi:hypothetical protein